MSLEEFVYQYDITKIQEVIPRNRDFKMLVPPGFYVNQYGGELYERFTSDLVANFSKNNMLFLDIGAHYGYYTLLVGTKHPTCEIIAFEPVPENFEILKRNVALNRLRNVELHNLAVSDKEGFKKLKVTEISGQSGFYEQHGAKPVKEIEVMTVSFDNFLKETRKVPTVVKIDTEGNEPYVLQGMRKFLRDSEEIKLIIEFNPDCLRSAGYDPTEFLREVFRFGFNIYVIDDDQRMTYKLAQDNLEKWSDHLTEGESKKTYTNMLCLKNQKSLGVLFFSHSAQLSGSERCLLELVTELVQDHGVVCSVVLPDDGPLRKKLEEVGASTLIFEYDWWYDSTLSSDDEVTRQLNRSFKTTLEKIKVNVEKINPDIIVTNTIVIPWGAMIASILNKPHVWFVHEFGRLDHGLEFYLPFQEILNIIRDSSNLILTNSNAVRKSLFGSIPESNILTVSCHIDIPQDALYGDGKDSFERKGATKLVIAGTICETKGQQDAILAVKELLRREKEVELIIVGYSNAGYLETLKGLVKSEKLEEFIKFYDFRENVYTMMNQADIVLVCSRNEAFGRVTLEAMLLGKPVVGTNSGGTPELIKEGFNGLSYETGDYNQLADSIEYLIENKGKIKEFGENGYKYAKEFFTKEEYGGRVYELLMRIRNDRNPTSSSHWKFVTRRTLDTLSNLGTTIINKDAQISHLEGLVRDKEVEIGSLRGTMNQKAIQISYLEGVGREKEAEIDHLKAGMAEKEKEVGSLKETINQKGSQISYLESVIREKEAALSGIYASYGWKALLIFYKLFEKIFPIDTKRRLLAKVIFWTILRPGEVFKNLNKTNLGKFFYFLSVVAPSVLEEEIEKKVSLTSPKSEARQIEGEFNEKYITLDKIKYFDFPSYEQPVVSIIIPVWNKWQSTVNCLKSISKNTASHYEVIVVNDASQDETGTILSKFKNLCLINNKENRGFIESRNLGAKVARGDFVLFLKNGTIVTKDWLTPLLEVIRREDVGAVGPKLVYPNGTLQEAGAIIWSDGTAFNYGRHDDPEKPEYNYVREVDYCSGACLLIKKELFNKVGGFDKRFNPGYCEESDFCLTLRNMGYKVMYQPASTVVHVEKIIFGLGVKKYQEIDEQKLREKWHNVLQKDHYSHTSSNLFLARDRRRGQRILFVDYSVPTYDKDAGSLSTYSHLKLLSEMGFRITFIPDNQVKSMPYTMTLQQMGIEVLYGNFGFDGWLQEFGKYIDLVWLSRPLTSIKYIDKIRERSPCKVIYYTQDLHYLREQRRYEVEKNKGSLEQATTLKQLEFGLFGKADVVLTPSSIERQIISQELPGKYVEVIPACIFFKSLAEEVIPFDSRNDILFLGSFAHPPNVDAVTFMTDEIFPLIKQELPKVCLYVVGSNPPRRMLKLKGNDIKVTGYVKDLSPYFDHCRIFVAPLRYGSGFKVKILTSMSYGLPVVTTNIGVEGMGLTEGENVLIADTPQEFARKVKGLYHDKILWSRISKNSIKYCKENFSYEVAKMKVERVLRDVTAPPMGKVD